MADAGAAVVAAEAEAAVSSCSISATMSAAIARLA